MLYASSYSLHPAQECRHTGEDSGLHLSIASLGGHEAGHTVDHILALNLTVQGAARVSLH